jgi:hypothetical protein
MRFSTRWRRAVLTVHIASAVGWFGVDLVLLTLGVAGLSGTADPAVVYPAQGLIGLFLFAPLSLLVWLVGVINALGTPWGLLRHWWVVTKLAIVTLMVVLVAFALLPNLLAALHDGAALAAPHRRNLVIAPIVSSTLLVISTTLSVYKPWGRTRNS